MIRLAVEGASRQSSELWGRERAREQGQGWKSTVSWVRMR